MTQLGTQVVLTASTTIQVHTAIMLITVHLIIPGNLFAVLESVGCTEQQHRLRDQYWKEQLPIIDVGSWGGVWDHVRAYAEVQWPRSHNARKERKQIFGDKRKFGNHVKAYTSDLVSSVVCTTKCGVCTKTGQHLLSLAACPMETFMKGDTLEQALLPSIRDIALRGHLVCKCGGNAKKTFIPKSTKLARLLVVVTNNRAVQHVPMEELDLGTQHGKYNLTGVGRCNGSHWVCSIKFDGAWYFYNDLTLGHNVQRENALSLNLPGFNNGVYFYTKM